MKVFVHEWLYMEYFNIRPGAGAVTGHNKLFDLSRNVEDTIYIIIHMNMCMNKNKWEYHPPDVRNPRHDLKKKLPHHFLTQEIDPSELYEALSLLKLYLKYM